MGAIERVRQENSSVFVIACCDDDPDIMRRLFDLKVNAVCPYDQKEKAVETLSKEFSRIKRTLTIENGLRSKLQRLEKIENGSTLEPSRSFVS